MYSIHATCMCVYIYTHTVGSIGNKTNLKHQLASTYSVAHVKSKGRAILSFQTAEDVEALAISMLRSSSSLESVACLGALACTGGKQVQGVRMQLY